MPLSKTGAELLFEVFSQRYERGSTLVTTNLPFDEWTEVFGSERLTGALLDRLTHHVNILEMDLPRFWWRACCSRPASHLELDRALVAERRVPPDRIVEPVDVSSHRVLGLAAGLPGDRPDQLGLDGLEERLDHSVVVAVCPFHSSRFSKSCFLSTA